ncbi:inositol monophosphatase family protein [Nakamurella lactea]|uniref:inositol monophosphatase family protein n=1 Tax=Nakamurella lactea TaxID=459515 RepID=UPI001FE019BB|nr:inositol monophosphatase [Nakamurella lactea]
MTISRALEIAGRLANDAAEVIAATAGRGAADPGVSPFDWVTDTDRTLERHTRRVLTGEFPGIPVLGEEYGGPDGLGPLPPALPGSADGPELLWVVDPIDGTANYLAGLPWCSYSLALLDADGPLVGVIADPYRAQIYAAARDRGLRANGSVVPRPAGPDPGAECDLTGRLICTELAGGLDHDLAVVLVDSCRRARIGLRMLGSPALAITQVALGRAAAAVLFDYQVWDVGGALALAAEAGLAVVTLDGSPGTLPLGGLVVAAPGTVPAVLALVGHRPAAAP